MSNFTTALLGSFSRIFFAPAASSRGPGILPTSQSDSDAARTFRRAREARDARARPSSAVDTEGYWAWDAPRGGVVLRRRTAGSNGDLNVDLAQVQTTSVLVCQPPQTPSPVDIPADGTVHQEAVPTPNAFLDVACSALATPCNSNSAPVAHKVHRLPSPLAYGVFSADADAELDVSFDVSLVSDTSTSTSASDERDSASDYDDASFDVSLISDTSTSTSASDERDSASDTSFNLPSPPTITGRGLGLGLLGLYNADGAPFDGMGALSFGLRCDPADLDDTRLAYDEPARKHRRRGEDAERGLSRAFMEEAVRTWAADPAHLMADVIAEDVALGAPHELAYLVGVPEKHTRPELQSNNSASSGTSTIRLRTTARPRDLSAASTVSSALKDRRSQTHADAPRAKTPRAFSVGPSLRAPSVVPGPRPPSVVPGLRVPTVVPGLRAPSVASGLRPSSVPAGSSTASRASRPTPAWRA
ncbi:hypothetical protein B0H15DRAFT_806011 [Mycena belliarum]|uniref:Uncharacterized protein n=1 Tax=Mycena belliarum TaxID=1033014 RepID=A0AAD6TTV3_9AGAR|nr:hypothetical protein B0H15DRAFT_806011 [Mycena belliae]